MSNETAKEHDRTAAPKRWQRVFARVMIVQIITLLLLWMLQSTFGGG